MNVIVCLEFELTYFEVAVQHFSHYATRTSEKFREEKFFLGFLVDVLQKLATENELLK